MENRKYTIYKIQNEIDRKVYIGSSISYKNRWKTHRWKLKANVHDNDHLQRAYNKHGKENFKFCVVESDVTGKNNCKDREDYHIDLNNSLNENFGYNKVYSNFESSPMPDHVKKRISKSMMGNPKVTKPICQYDIKTGNLIHEWGSASEAARELFSGICQSNITQCCKKNKKYTNVKGFGFCYKYDFPNNIQVAPNFKSLKNGLTRVSKVKSIDKNGEVTVYNSIREASDVNDYSYKVVSRCVAGHRPHAYNLRWEYVNG